MQNILLNILIAFIVLLISTGLYCLLIMFFYRYRAGGACLCLRCGRSERMKQYAHEPRIRTRTSYLLYCGLLPGFFYYIWTSRFCLCPHCLNVASYAELSGRRVDMPRKKRRRRS